MQRRRFIQLAGGGTVAAATLASASLAGCSSRMPPQAIEAWNGPAPALLQGDVRHWLLSYAILAPHSHNLQSWVADLRTPSEIVLYCDLQRLLPQTDPLSRQILMSHGTFLELLDLAARERGLRAEITLFPQGTFGPDKLDARPVARVQLAPDSSVKPDPLFAHILQRHTNRQAYDMTRAVAPAAVQVLRDSGAGASLIGVVGLENPETMARHRQIALDAWRIELTTPRTIMESFDVLRIGASEIATHRDGISLMAPVPVALARLGLFDRSRPPAPDDYATTSQIQDFSEKLQATPAFLWMRTPDNQRSTQVLAGRAYARVQLAATSLGLSMQPLSQALQEYPEMRQSYAEVHALLGARQPGDTVQMWARLGYAQAAEPAPRRPLQDFIRA